MNCFQPNRWKLGLVRGRRVPILGTPSLEHTRLDLTDVPDTEIGHEVVIIGRQGNEIIQPEEVGKYQGLSVPELAMAVRGIVCRTYIGL